ncbi:MAG TPA: pyruvate kinase [Bacteroidetes bacterium]|nr:pyruvate kinase [Bacteroidota bacterium]
MQEIHHKNTKIVATVGPASRSYENLLELIRAGVDIFRLNFSHGTHEDHQKVIQQITYINEKYNYHIGILADLQGPKLRVGTIKNEPLLLETGDEITFVNKECEGTKAAIYMSYQKLPKDVEPGELILVDDGKIQLEVLETNRKDKVKLKVLHGGPLTSRKGVNLPNTKISLPSLTKKDRKDLDFMLTQPINWIALSFVRSAKDMKDLQKLINEKGHPAKTIAKIEKPEAVQRIDKIIKYSNGIMIARGDLGIEMPIEELPVIQKNIIKKCIQRARPVIVATQMMESMMKNPSPTRPEVTDVANAVLDGADAVMLSGETAVGDHPTLVVETMEKIIGAVESNEAYSVDSPMPAPKASTYLSDVICLNAVTVAKEIKAKALTGMTVSGYTAFKLSSCRPKRKIYIFSEHIHMLATLNLVWGVNCFYYNKYNSTDETIHDLIEIMKNTGCVEPGDLVVNLMAMPIKRRFMTNTLKITEVE